MSRIATDEINARNTSERLSQQSHAPVAQPNRKKTLSADDVVGATGQDPGRQSLIAKTTGNVSPARSGLEGDDPVGNAVDKKNAAAASDGSSSERNVAADSTDAKTDKSKKKDLAEVNQEQERINFLVRNQS